MSYILVYASHFIIPISLLTVLVLLPLLVAGKSTQWFISVSSNGTDVKQCLLGNGSTPCRTLHYCLNGIPTLFSAHQKIIILLASNQTISSVVEYQFETTNNNTITITGVGWSYLLFETCASMKITAINFQGGHWVWERIEILGSTIPCSKMEDLL